MKMASNAETEKKTDDYTFNFLVRKEYIDEAKKCLNEKKWKLVKELDENEYGILWLVWVPYITGKEMIDDLGCFLEKWLIKWTSKMAIMPETVFSRRIPDIAMMPKLIINEEKKQEVVEKKHQSNIKPKLRIIPKVDQSWSIKRIASECVPSGWEKFFELAYPEICEISDMLDEIEKRDGGYLPLKKDIFNFMWLTKPNAIKICVIGQDPYFQILGSGMPRAMGLAFSVRRDDSIPNSLQNIYKELSNSIEGFKIPTHGDLTKWARQGVFLPNMCLTVRQNEAGSHKS